MGICQYKYIVKAKLCSLLGRLCRLHWRALGGEHLQMFKFSCVQNINDVITLAPAMHTNVIISIIKMSNTKYIYLSPGFGEVDPIMSNMY